MQTITIQNQFTETEWNEAEKQCHLAANKKECKLARAKIKEKNSALLCRWDPREKEPSRRSVYKHPAFNPDTGNWELITLPRQYKGQHLLQPFCEPWNVTGSPSKFKILK